MTQNLYPDDNDALSHWNQRFSSPEFIFGTEPNQWLSAHAKVWRPGHRILCVADGEGRNSVWLAQQGMRIDAFDLSDIGVAKAQLLAKERRVDVNFSIADCDDFEYRQEHYDGVAAIFIQFADPDMRGRLFGHIKRCLKPGGFLLLQGYTPEQLVYKTGGPSLESHLYNEALIRGEFSDFDVQILESYEAVLDEGPRHSGRSALLGMVARKP